MIEFRMKSGIIMRKRTFKVANSAKKRTYACIMNVGTGDRRRDGSSRIRCRNLCIVYHSGNDAGADVFTPHFALKQL